MGERKGQNFYYPPDFNPKKHFSLNAYHGTHALREKAVKIKQGIIIIRFEMPYNIWCESCKNHIGMGVRYDAEKSKIGMYYTTPIYKFKMRCKICTNVIEIKSDPANHDYIIITGGRRVEQRFDPHSNEQIVATDHATQKKLALDAMFKLEHGETDKEKTKKAAPGLTGIANIQQQYKDDFISNKVLRDNFRKEKKVLENVKKEDDALLKKSSLDIKLLPAHEDDIKEAKLLKLNHISSDEKEKKRKDVLKSSIFDSSHSSKYRATSNALNNRKRSKTTQDSAFSNINSNLGIKVAKSSKTQFSKSLVCNYNSDSE